MPKLSERHALTVRRSLLAFAAAAAVSGVLSGLSRLGIAAAWGSELAPLHGGLFVLGFFGTVISLERAVALGRAWGYAAPSCSALAALALLARARWAAWPALFGALALVALNVAIVRKQAEPFTRMMLLGSLVLLAGNALFAAGFPVFQVVWTWIAFFVLTIAAERLELSRLAQTPRWAGHLLTSCAYALAVSACARALGSAAAGRALGVTLALIGTWQLCFDLARRTARLPGLPRFVALGVLLGAAWLVVAGTLVAGFDVPAAGPRYDAALHAVLVGYVVSMVFAHAPIILPAVTRVRFPFHALLYVPLATLHLSLALRLTGDLSDQTALRGAGASGNAAALILYVLTVGWLKRR